MYSARMKRPLSFTIEKRDEKSLARAGTISTPHGDIKTPAFIAVATKATTKGLGSFMYGDMGIQAVIANAYHLYLTPGEKTVERAGGVGTFMSWDGPTMTDSGGFQVFSLGEGFGKIISKIHVENPPAGGPREAGIGVYDEDIATAHRQPPQID